MLLALIASITTITILAPQIRRRKYYFMDVFSIIYFSIASICTLIFSINVFILSPHVEAE
ncbi:MAG: hypothetical protein QXD12_02975 [Candidatus Nezhaarchaeales archaeon]